MFEIDIFGRLKEINNSNIVGMVYYKMRVDDNDRSDRMTRATCTDACHVSRVTCHVTAT